MATNQLPENFENYAMVHFDRVVSQIEQTFNQLTELLIGRKEFLLQKVLQLREEFFSKEAARREAIQELEKTQKQLGQVSKKANLNIPIHQQASEAYEQGMKNLVHPTKLPFLSFSCPGRDKLVKLVEGFGDVSVGSFLTFKTGENEGEFANPTGLALDELNQVIYIADMGNSRIQSFSFQGEFRSTFGEKVLKEPYGIAATNDHIFITDLLLNSLLRFDKKTLQLVDKVGGGWFERQKLNRPQGLSIDSNGDIYIADGHNHRVSIFSKALKYVSSIGEEILIHPHDVELTTESVAVLDRSDKCVHFFTRDEFLLSLCIINGSSEDCLVRYPIFFCLDKDRNIVISDFNNDAIKVISRGGELIHVIGDQRTDKNKSLYPQSIAISDDGTIYMVSQNFCFFCKISKDMPSLFVYFHPKHY